MYANKFCLKNILFYFIFQQAYTSGYELLSSGPCNQEIIMRYRIWVRYEFFGPKVSDRPNLKHSVVKTQSLCEGDLETRFEVE